MTDVYTEHLLLRALQKEDLPHLHELCSDERITAFMRFDTTHSMKESNAILTSFLKEPLSCGIWVNKQMIGVFSYKQTQEPDVYDISVFFHPNAWNKGYFSEILAYMLPYAKEVLKAKKVKGFILENNPASCRVAEKFGFQHIHSFTPDEEGVILRIYELNM